VVEGGPEDDIRSVASAAHAASVVNDANKGNGNNENNSMNQLLIDNSVNKDTIAPASKSMYQVVNQ